MKPLSRKVAGASNLKTDIGGMGDTRIDIREALQESACRNMDEGKSQDENITDSSDSPALSSSNTTDSKACQDATVSTTAEINQTLPEEKEKECNAKSSKTKERSESNLKNRLLIAIKSLKKKKKLIAISVIGVLLVLLCLAYILSPGNFRGDKYDFIFYKSYINMADYSGFTYDESADKEQEKMILLSRLVNGTEFKKVPSKQYEHEKELITSRYENMAESYGMTYSELIKATGTNKKDWNQQIKDSAEQKAKENLVVNVYINENNVKTSRKDYKKFCDSLLKTYDLTEKDFEEQAGQTFEEFCKESDMYSEYLKSAAADDLYEKSKPKIPASELKANKRKSDSSEKAKSVKKKAAEAAAEEEKR